MLCGPRRPPRPLAHHLTPLNGYVTTTSSSPIEVPHLSLSIVDLGAYDALLEDVGT